MAKGISFFIIGILVTASLGGAFNLLQSHGQQPSKAAVETPARYSVSTEVLPGHLSMTLFYITDAESNKLYIYRTTGGMDTSFKGDPELYRTYDLTSAGEKQLKRAE